MIFYYVFQIIRIGQQALRILKPLSSWIVVWRFSVQLNKGKYPPTPPPFNIGFSCLHHQWGDLKLGNFFSSLELTTLEPKKQILTSL